MFECAESFHSRRTSLQCLTLSWAIDPEAAAWYRAVQTLESKTFLQNFALILTSCVLLGKSLDLPGLCFLSVKWGSLGSFQFSLPGDLDEVLSNFSMMEGLNEVLSSSFWLCDLVTLGKSLNFFGPQCPHLKNEGVGLFGLFGLWGPF